MSELIEAAPEPCGAPGEALTQPPPERLYQEIWALSWPVILSFALDSVLGLASMLMVGRLGADAVGAVGLGGQVLNGVRAGIAAVGTGTVALVARDVGAGDTDHAEIVLTQSVVFGVIVSSLIAIPVIVFAPQALSVFGVKGSMANLGTRYLRIVMLSEPFGGIFFMGASALRGAGDTRTPLWIGAVTDVLAIFLNYALIFGKFGFPALGVDGCAIATLIAIAIGGGLFLWVLSLENAALRFRWRLMRPDPELAWRVLKVGYPAAVEQLVIQFGFFAYVRFVASYGEASVAAYFIGVRILALSFLPGFGFAAAAATLVGQGLGARDKKFSRRAGWHTTYMAITMMSALGLLIFLFARQIAVLFISDPAVIALTITFMYALGAAQPLMAIDWTISGALRGAGDTQFPLFASIAGFYGLRLALTILIVYYGGSVTWVWWSLMADYLLRSSLKSGRFWSGHWENVEV
jgi:putative MATE family efflux protein